MCVCVCLSVHMFSMPGQSYRPIGTKFCTQVELIYAHVWAKNNSPCSPASPTASKLPILVICPLLPQFSPDQYKINKHTTGQQEHHHGEK